uniref:Uncharacterized protein n=1 Tax=Anguilla anguilla TaxID=7936 RepID=A0A0E9PDY5_ANGAN
MALLTLNAGNVK